MKVLYINDELATHDGSNYHALGIFHNLIKLIGEENVRSYPAAADGSAAPAAHDSLAFREKHKFVLQLLRLVRKTMLSRTRAKKLVRKLEADGFVPTHVLARSVLFDTTAISVASHFSAKLVYEVNTPMYYEHCEINGLPLQRAVERWERKILEKCHGIYVVSSICRDMLCKHYGLSPEKFMVIPNGYMEELFPRKENQCEQIRHNIRQREQWEEKFIITFIGSLKGWHGIDSLCEIAEALEKHTHLHFLVVGDGREHETIVKYCTSHTNMTYQGKLSLQDMAECLLASDLGIMPYHTMDNFYFSPLKMYDMIGAELPFLGTGQGQIAELCQDYLSSDFLLQNNAALAVAKQILQLSAQPDTVHSMKKCIQKLKPLVTWHARTAQVLAYLRSL